MDIQQKDSSDEEMKEREVPEPVKEKEESEFLHKSAEDDNIEFVKPSPQTSNDFFMAPAPPKPATQPSKQPFLSPDEGFEAPMPMGTGMDMKRGTLDWGSKKPNLSTPQQFWEPPKPFV